MKELIHACSAWKRHDPALAVSCQNINLPLLVIKCLADDQDDIWFDPDGEIDHYPLNFIPNCVDTVKSRCPKLRGKIMHFIDTETQQGIESNRLQLKLDI